MTEIVAEIVAERASLRHHNIVVVSVPANATGGRPRSGCMMIMSYNIIYYYYKYSRFRCILEPPCIRGGLTNSWYIIALSLTLYGCKALVKPVFALVDDRLMNFIHSVLCMYLSTDTGSVAVLSAFTITSDVPY